MKTVAKFKLEELAMRENDTRVAKFRATTADADWSKFTPAGTLEIWVTNPACEFNVGKIYTLTLEEE